jgi:hypothetical protein
MRKMALCWAAAAVRAVSIMVDAGGAVSAPARLAANARARTAIPFIAAIVLAGGAVCQGPDVRFSSDVNMVSLLATVRGGRRHRQEPGWDDEAERKATDRFVEQMLRQDKDAATVVHFDVRLGMLQDFTS